MTASPVPQMPYARIAYINDWLDERNSGMDSRHDDAQRILKLTEECGEVAAAYIGMTGQNPRKGVTHSMRDVLDELADVAIAAMCAIQHFTGDANVTAAIMNQKTDMIIHRITLRPHVKS